MRVRHWSGGLSLLGMVLCLLLGGTAQAQSSCTPTETAVNRVQLFWDAPQPPPKPGLLTGYVLERQKDAGAWQEYRRLDASTLTFTDLNLDPGTYVYRLYAIGKEGAVEVKSVYAKHGAPAPCVTVTVLPAPGNFRAVAQ